MGLWVGDGGVDDDESLASAVGGEIVDGGRGMISSLESGGEGGFMLHKTSWSGFPMSCDVFIGAMALLLRR